MSRVLSILSDLLVNLWGYRRAFCGFCDGVGKCSFCSVAEGVGVIDIVLLRKLRRLGLIFVTSGGPYLLID